MHNATLESRQIRQECWTLSWPAMLSGLSVPLLGLVDTSIVGHLGGTYPIAAVALASWLFDVMYWAFGFLRMGTTGLVAQHTGQRDLKPLFALLVRASALAIGIGSALLFILPWCASPLLEWMTQESQIHQEAVAYFHARLWGGPAVLLNYVLLGTLLGTQHPRWALCMQVGMNSLNCWLSWQWSIDYGVVGVGAASALSQWITLLVMIGIWGGKKKEIWKTLTFPLIREALLHLQAWKAVLFLNINLMIRTLVLLASFGLLHWVGGQLGGIYVALNSLFLHLQSLHAFALDGFAHGAEVLIGQAYGQQNQKRLRLILRESTRLTVISACILTGVYWLGSGWILSLLTNETQLLDLIPQYQIWIILTPLFSAACFLLDGVAIGLTASKAMRTSMIISGLLYGLSLLIWVPLFHNHGVWVAFLSFMVARAFTLWIPLVSYFK